MFSTHGNLLSYFETDVSIQNIIISGIITYSFIAATLFFTFSSFLNQAEPLHYKTWK